MSAERHEHSSDHLPEYAAYWSGNRVEAKRLGLLCREAVHYALSDFLSASEAERLTLDSAVAARCDALRPRVGSASGASGVYRKFWQAAFVAAHCQAIDKGLLDAFEAIVCEDTTLRVTCGPTGALFSLTMPNYGVEAERRPSERCLVVVDYLNVSRMLDVGAGAPRVSVVSSSGGDSLTFERRMLDDVGSPLVVQAFWFGRKANLTLEADTTTVLEYLLKDALKRWA